MKKNVLFYAKLMCLSYILTALLVLIFSFIVYKNYMSDSKIRIGIIVIYALVNILSGFISGKIKKNKKYLWGFISGITYIVVLAILSFLVTGEFMSNTPILIPSTLACILGGTFGGMIS